MDAALARMGDVDAALARMVRIWVRRLHFTGDLERATKSEEVAESADLRIGARNEWSFGEERRGGGFRSDRHFW